MCGSWNRRRSRGLSFAGRSRTVIKAFHCFSSRTKRVWSASTCSAFSRALRMMNSVTLTPCRSAATLMSVSSEAVARSWKRRSRDWLGVDIAMGPSVTIVLPMYFVRASARMHKAEPYATPDASLCHPDHPEARHCGTGPLGGVPADRALWRDHRGAPSGDGVAGLRVDAGGSLRGGELCARGARHDGRQLARAPVFRILLHQRRIRTSAADTGRSAAAFRSVHKSRHAVQRGGDGTRDNARGRKTG